MDKMKMISWTQNLKKIIKGISSKKENRIKKNQVMIVRMYCKSFQKLLLPEIKAIAEFLLTGPTLMNPFLLAIWLANDRSVGWLNSTKYEFVNMLHKILLNSANKITT